jgi:hypothetical protein
LFRFFVAKDNELPWPLLTAALIPVYVVLCGGSAFVAAIEPIPTKYLLLLAPAAPLLLWLFAWGPLAKLKGPAAIVAQCIVVMIIPACLLASSLLQAEPVAEWSGHPSTFSIVASGR